MGGDRPAGGAGKLDTGPAMLDGAGAGAPGCPVDSFDGISLNTSLHATELRMNPEQHTCESEVLLTLITHCWARTAAEIYAKICVSPKETSSHRA